MNADIVKCPQDVSEEPQCLFKTCTIIWFLWFLGYMIWSRSLKVTSQSGLSPSWQKHFFGLLSLSKNDEVARIPSVSTLVVLLQTKWIPTVTAKFGEENKWVKGGEIKLTGMGMFTREKYRREESHRGAFVSLVQPGSAAHMHWKCRKVCWICATEIKWKEEEGGKKLKTRPIIGFGSAWTWVCAQQCGCVCTAGACAQGHLSRERGLALPGTATVRGWRITGRLPLPVLPFSGNKPVKNEQGSQKIIDKTPFQLWERLF